MDWVDEFIKYLLDDKGDEAYNLRYSSIPSKLYRFESVSDEKLKTLKSAKIYLASKNQFNDINECKGIYASKKFIDNLKNKYKAFREEEWIEYIETAGNGARICCFTEEINNFPMWWSYADSHKGYCVEYDFKSLVHKEEYNFIAHLYPIKYINSRICVDRLYNLLINRIELEEDPGLTWQDYAHIYMQFCLKHVSWSYEKEWRFINFSEERSFYNLPVKPSAIYIGMDMTDENIEKLKEVALQLPCKLYKMKKLNNTSELFDFQIIDM